MTSISPHFCEIAHFHKKSELRVITAWIWARPWRRRSFISFEGELGAKPSNQSTGFYAIAEATWHFPFSEIWLRPFFRLQLIVVIYPWVLGLLRSVPWAELPPEPLCDQLCFRISCFSHVWLFRSHGLQPPGSLCPWGFSKQNTELDAAFPFSGGIFPARGWISLSLI